MRLLIFRLIILALPFVPGLAIALDQSAEQSAFRDLQNVVDEEVRIVEELKIFRLGAGEHKDQQTSNRELVSSHATENGDKTYHCQITFGRGFSLSEIADLVSNHEFLSVPRLAAKFLDGEKNMVTTIMFQQFDMWRGSAYDVLNYLIADAAHTHRMFRERLGNDEPGSGEERLSNPNALRFYEIDGFLTAKDMDMLKNTLGEDLLFVEMVEAEPPQVPQELKQELPAGHFHFKPPSESASWWFPQFFREVKEVVIELPDQLIALIVPYAHAAVNTSCILTSRTKGIVGPGATRITGFVNVIPFYAVLYKFEKSQSPPVSSLLLDLPSTSTFCAKQRAAA